MTIDFSCGVGRVSLVRSGTGRRSAGQIAALSWTVDPEPYVKVFQFGPFTMSPIDIDE